MTTPSSNASAPPPSSAPSAEPSRAPPGSPSSSLVGPVSWASSERETAFRHWLAAVVQDHALDGDTVRIASADASARRYLRINGSDGRTSRIIMDAPPQLEDCKPFVRVARLMSEAGVHVPRIWAWDEPTGFMLLDDLGARTLLDVVDREQPSNNLAWFQGAIDELLRWQLASQKDVLAPYDEPLLMRELALFSDWYLDRHRDVRVTGTLRETLEQQYRLIVGRNLSVPSVYVHRDFMPRNLMVPVGFGKDAETRLGQNNETRLGVLDFQDAVYGPITYDIACLTRDAFVSWDEAFVLDVTVRYWQAATKAGLLGAKSSHGWGADFGEFYQAVDWMALQRALKVAGIFARLTLRDGKPQYLADTPRFIAYIRAIASRYRELTPLLRLVDQVEGTSLQTAYGFGRG